ncbi:hypothetical protein QBC34DRAFT_333125, partial [Podospora aff. communis PSN243]
MDRHNNYDARNQAGLEVVPPSHSLYSQQLPEVRPESWNAAKEVVLPKYPEAPQHLSHASKAPVELSIAPADSPAAPKKRWNRRRLIIIGGVVAVVVIVAAVLGGVLGSKNASKAEDSASDAVKEGSNPTTTPGASPQFARQGSPLSVTAKRKIDGGVDMLLFYQDTKGEIGYARCDTTKTPQGASCWRTNGTFASHSTDRTQLAATSLVWETRMQPQTQLFYTGGEIRLLGTNMNDQSDPRIVEDSINNMGYTTDRESSLTAYWPWLICQSPNGGLVHVRNNPPANLDPSANWGSFDIGVTALAGTKLAMVPVSTNYTKIADKGGYAVFYQGTDSRLLVFITHLNELNSSYVQSWSTTLPSITMPKRAAIAAFSVARPADTQQRVDTYVLYLDSASNINMLYTDSSSGTVST